MAAYPLRTLVKILALACLSAVCIRVHQSRHLLVSRLNFPPNYDATGAIGSSTSSRSKNKLTDSVVFPVKPLVIWSNDYHVAPINDLKQLLQPLGVRFIDKSLSGHCHVTNTCEGRKTLKVINRRNAMHLDPSLIPQFVQAYANDSEILSADAFACFLPPAMCELFEPFNRSLLIIVPTRYEAGRLASDRWTRWNENLLRMSKDPRNLIAANNLYDAEYVRYFTGIRPKLLPSYCGYLLQSYGPVRSGFILAPIHNDRFAALFMKWHRKSCRKVYCTVGLFPLRRLYPHYNYSDIASHQGIVYVPYQVSVMSLFEQYRMNIPLFFPSIELLTRWQLKYTVMKERTWDGVYKQRPPRSSSIAPHPSQSHLPDPNNEQNRDAVSYWIKFSDFYQMPHITYFDSVDHLVEILEKATPANLMKTSELMKEYNARVKVELTQQWKEILHSIAKYSPNAPH